MYARRNAAGSGRLDVDGAWRAPTKGTDRRRPCLSRRVSGAATGASGFLACAGLPSGISQPGGATLCWCPGLYGDLNMVVT